MSGAIFRFENLITLLDIAVVAAVLYWVMAMVRGTRAERMLWGLAVVVIVYFVSERAELVTLHWLLSNFLGSIVIFIIVVFQQDIKRALVRMGRTFSPGEAMKKSSEVLGELTSAVVEMSRTKTGAILVIERNDDLGSFLETGVEMDSRVSRELLLAIFNPGSPMHDGAVVVRGERLLKAGCILPLTEKELPEPAGTRKRAALGLAEETDAVVIAVSEKTGEITLAVDDELTSGIGPWDLLEELKSIFSSTPRAAFLIPRRKAD